MVVYSALRDMSPGPLFWLVDTDTHRDKQTG